MGLLHKVKGKPRKEIVQKLKLKYRLLIINDENLEEKFSFLLSPMNVFIWGGTISISIIIIIILTIAFTPLREYIPGYSDINTKRNAAKAVLKADSLEQKLYQLDLYIKNIQSIINGEPILLTQSTHPDSLKPEYKNLEAKSSKEDSLLRNLVEIEDSYNVNSSSEVEQTLSKLFLFPPLKGVITSGFDKNEKHFGIDIVASKNEAVKSIADGTVIISSWTSESGYIIQVQHAFNMISVYKHNSMLLKKEGERVKAGEAIAIIGNTGELTTGPHVHFEIWLEGKPVDPQKLIVF